MERPPHAAAAPGLLAVLLAASTAQAQGKLDSAYDRAVAEMVAHRYEIACPMIEDVYRLDPRPGILFTLAECEAGRGRIATAVARYDDYLAIFAQMPPDKQAKQQGRERLALTARAALVPHVPQLTVRLPFGAPLDTVLRCDGAVISTLGNPLPVDPGEHLVTSQAPGEPPVDIRVQVARGEKKEMTLPIPASHRDMPLLVPAALAAPPSPPPRPPPGPSGLRIAGFVVGGLGVAGVVAGSVLGGLVLAKQSIVADQCMGKFCTREGVDAVRAAVPLGAGSTAGFVAGAAGVVIGTVLLVVARPARRSASAPLRVGVLSLVSSGVGNGAGSGVGDGAALGLKGSFR